MAGVSGKCMNPLSLVQRVRRISANAQVYIVTLNIPEAYGRTPWRKAWTTLEKTKEDKDGSSKHSRGVRKDTMMVPASQMNTSRNIFGLITQLE